MDEIVRLEAEVERFRNLAHNAPLNPVRTNHDGHRWVEQHSSAWAYFSRQYADALSRLNRAKAEAGVEVRIEPRRAG